VPQSANGASACRNFDPVGYSLGYSPAACLEAEIARHYRTSTKMTRTRESDRSCTECWVRAVYAYGTAQQLLKRSRKSRSYLRRLAFIGIAGPVVIGGMVIHGIAPDYLDVFLWVVGIIAIIEALVSVWSLAATWADNLSYSQRSTAENLAPLWFLANTRLGGRCHATRE
jgi:hypothetical protein